MYEECLEGLDIKEDGIYLDMTVGGFGHGRGICERLSEKGTYIGFDLDSEALGRAEAGRDGLRCRVELVHDNFHNFEEHLGRLGIEKVDGILADLGVSSFQIDEADRGFSFMREGPLDMRMDRDAPVSAYDIVNGYSREELAGVIREYGEEQYAWNISGAIVREREISPISTTAQLAAVIEKSVPAKYRRTSGKNVATKTFQALRIETNGEIAGLRETVDAFIDRLSPGGRLCIISFHSLEDRAVKEVFAERAKGCICPKDFPVCVCGRKPEIKLISRGAMKAAGRELEDNPRSRSARLRICEKI